MLHCHCAATDADAKFSLVRFEHSILLCLCSNNILVFIFISVYVGIVIGVIFHVIMWISETKNWNFIEQKKKKKNYEHHIAFRHQYCNIQFIVMGNIIKCLVVMYGISCKNWVAASAFAICLMAVSDFPIFLPVSQLLSPS